MTVRQRHGGTPPKKKGANGNRPKAPRYESSKSNSSGPRHISQYLSAVFAELFARTAPVGGGGKA